MGAEPGAHVGASAQKVAPIRLTANSRRAYFSAVVFAATNVLASASQMTRKPTL